MIWSTRVPRRAGTRVAATATISSNSDPASLPYSPPTYQITHHPPPYHPNRTTSAVEAPSARRRADLLPPSARDRPRCPPPPASPRGAGVHHRARAVKNSERSRARPWSARCRAASPLDGATWRRARAPSRWLVALSSRRDWRPVSCVSGRYIVFRRASRDSGLVSLATPTTMNVSPDTNAKSSQPGPTDPDSLLHRSLTTVTLGPPAASAGAKSRPATVERRACGVSGPDRDHVGFERPSSGGSVDRALTLMREPPAVTGSTEAIVAASIPGSATTRASSVRRTAGRGADRSLGA